MQVRIHSKISGKSACGGFTMVEILLVIAMVSLISFVTAPLGIQFYNSQNIDGMQGQLGDILTKARSQAIVQKGDLQYGIYLQHGFTPEGVSTTPSFTLYAGPSYALRDTTRDESYLNLADTLITLPTSTTMEINFAKHTGTPSATGTISIYWNGLERNILLDDMGTVLEK
jgi:prepilin-type N-terminal cleavage/methylation domain-containing protein